MSSFDWELELLGVFSLSHQCRHPGGLPSLSELDGHERSLMAAVGDYRDGARAVEDCRDE